MTTTQADMPDDDLRFHHVKAMVLIHVDETGTCPSLEDTLCALAKRHIPMERQRVSSTLDQIVSSAEFSERLRGAEERVLFPRALQQLRTLSEDLCGARAVTVVELASAVGTTAMVVDEALRRKAAKLHITIPELLDRERQLGERLCRNRSEFEDLRKAITWPNIRRWVGFRGLTSSELTSAANLGFEHALRHYRRSESGFTRYASRVVRNAVYREVNPISPSLLALLRDIAAATHELMQRLEHRPTLDEIATELSTTDRVVTREQIEEALKAYRLAWADQPPEGDDEDDSDTEAIARIAWASGMTREPENALPGELPAFIALVLDVLGADQVRLLLATPATMTGAERRRLHRA
ncbi:MAG: sigma-70 domain-containing protein, partial [Planctomycetota bacterium]